jgi:hypothetical protein
MSQHDLDIANQTFPVTRTDLNNALKALGSLQSGDTAPATTYANSLWYDTTNNILKLRNADNDAWIEVFDVNQTADVIELVSKLKAPNGSASLPSMTFDSDTDTGIYRKSANTLAITAGGSESTSFTASSLTTVTANITTVDLGDWTITESSGTLYFATGGTNKMMLTATGDLTVVGDVTAYGTI